VTPLSREKPNVQIYHQLPRYTSAAKTTTLAHDLLSLILQFKLVIIPDFVESV